MDYILWAILVLNIGVIPFVLMYSSTPSMALMNVGGAALMMICLSINKDF